ncbi:MAG: CoA transferase, partial [Actinomycetota bacterium]|nr:CoA transferase [Actinomycetota bacterium]
VVANLGQRFERFDHRTANPLNTQYETSDRWIAIAAVQNEQWIEIAQAAGLAHLLQDSRFESIDAVQAHREEFRSIFAAHLKTDTVEHWCRALRTTTAWVGPVHELEDLAADESILVNDYLATFPDGFVAPPTPFDVDGFKGARGAAAEYGEHTDELLAEYGYSDDEILDLRINGAVW